jgi:hypothetical protein
LSVLARQCRQLCGCGGHDMANPSSHHRIRPWRVLRRLPAAFHPLPRP